MDIDDFADWAEAAIQYRRDMNKALAKAQKSRR
ncbi:hypothetical protein QO017_005137 [Methylobacterium gregans]|nr:hypothetical protein [Methylobacterium gregans]